MGNSVDKVIGLARVAEISGDPDRALHILREAVAAEPNDMAILLALARILALHDRHDEVVTTISKAKTCGEIPAVAYSALARSLSELGRFSEATEAMQTALRLQPFAHRYVLLGSYLERLNMSHGARDAYEHALQLDPDDDEAQCNLARLLQDDDPVRSEALLSRVVALNNENSVAHRELGQLLAKQGRLNEARVALNVATSLNPLDTWAHIWLAQVFMDLGDMKNAEQHCRMAIDSARDEPFAYCKLGDIQKTLGNIQGAQASYRRARDLDRDNTAYIQRLEELTRPECGE